MLSEREQTERTLRRVLDDFNKTGALPGPFIRSVQASAFKRSGHIPTPQEVEAKLAEWVPRWLEQIDNGADPETAAQD